MYVFHYIDDNEMLLEIFETMITSANKSVLTFSSPVRYLEYLESSEYKAPVAVFTDIRMPIINGYQLIDKVCERFPGQRFITLSAFEELQKGGHKSACMHIRKPFRADALMAAVDLLIRCDEDGPDLAELKCEEFYLGMGLSGSRSCPCKGRCPGKKSVI